MESAEETELLRIYLQEALEMLDDMRHNLGLFEKQRYYRFRNKLEGHAGKLQRDSNSEMSLVVLPEVDS